jgi:hypothetical protein
MPYTKKVDSLNPGCFIFLLDQSDSMNYPAYGRSGLSRAHALANAINDLLVNLIRRCTKERDEPPRHYFDIGVFGYSGTTAQSLLGGQLAGRKLVSAAELKNAPLGTEERHGALLPVWVQPFGAGVTPMCAALKLGGGVAHAWARSHPDSFPPIVINITDGMATDNDAEADTEVWATRLQSIRTNDGNLLLFNIHISGISDTSVVFPDSPQLLAVSDLHAQLLFRMSSELPEIMLRAAGRLGLTVGPGARGLVCNGSIDAVVFALEVGTAIGPADTY